MTSGKAVRLIRRIMYEPNNVGELIREYLNPLIDGVNDQFKAMSLKQNFDVYTIEGATVPASGESKLSHKLGVEPKSRLIVKQVGGGAITDGEFTKDYVVLKNDGATDASITVILFKE